MLPCWNGRSIGIARIAGRGDECEVGGDFAGEFRRWNAVQQRRHFGIYLAFRLRRITGIFHKVGICEQKQIRRRLPFESMGDMGRIDDLWYIIDRESALCNDRIINNFFHSQMNIPASRREFDGIGITCILFSGYSKSEINEAGIMCQRFIGRDA